MHLKSKTGHAVTTAFQSIIKDPTYSKPVHRRPVLVQTDRAKVFLNRTFQDMLKRIGIQFHVCRKLDVKCAFAERAHRILRNKFKVFYIQKHLDTLTCYQFVKAYNTVHRVAWRQPL